MCFRLRAGVDLSMRVFGVSSFWQYESWRCKRGSYELLRRSPFVSRDVAVDSTPRSRDRIAQEFIRDLIDYFQDCDMDGTDLRRIHPEIDKALDELGVGEG